MEKKDFQIGDRVSFRACWGPGWITGTIKKLNPKRAIVTLDKSYQGTNREWNIQYSSLKKA